MTHGPAISTSGPPPMVTPPATTFSGVRGGVTRLTYHGRCRMTAGRRLVRVAGLDESGEQRVRLERLRRELRVELHRDIPGMRRQLDDLDELAVERAAHDLESLVGERLLVQAVELVAVAVATVDHVAAVERVGPGSRLQLTGVRPETHRAAEIVDAEQVAQLVNELGRRVRRAFGRVRVGESDDVARVFDGGPLEAVADAEVGNVALARDLRRAHHAARAAIAEAARHEDAVGAVEELLAARLLERLGLHPADVHFQAVLEA